MATYDLIVIGGGPAGYVGAIRAAQLGKKVACVEKERAGGTCLNWGCIPTKALLKNAELYHTLKHDADSFGISFDNLSYDWSKVIKRSRNVSDKLAGGIEFLFKKNKVDYIRGTGGLAANGKVEVINADDNSEQIKLDRGFIDTDSRYQTTVPNVYAAGDITGPPWLAHTGSYEAIQAIEGIFIDGHEPKQVGIFPACTYCHPEVASIGLTEEACKEQGLDYRIGKFPFAASGRALAVAESDGFVKVIFDNKHGEILGAHMIGAGSTELIAEIALAMSLEATAEEIEATIHAHPTLAEAVHEATSDAYGHAIHI
ncbi:UNVERIFIED_CONTAM: hypothetical protein GTU68_019932 [Idotea baltica]|nr:hypothetical protein [Idotea baltica]